MTYLDYSATTMINSEVLKEIEENLFKIPTKEELKKYKQKIQKILNTDLEVNITSGSTESNNWALKGICQDNTNIKNKIITTEMEHSSINETLEYLKTKGYEVIYAPLKDGIIDIDTLEKLLTKEVSLITVASVNSETGTKQPVEKLAELSKKYKIPFHCDMTQSIGKINISLKNIDLISISAHKIYGPKGIGLLLKNKDLSLKNIIYGERKYNLGLIKGLTKALEISMKNQEKNYKKVEDLQNYLKDNLKSLPNIIINQSKSSIPHILNISVLNYKPETFLHYLEQDKIYISTKSACSTTNSYSKSVYALTNNKHLAETSVRISISHLTTKEELDKVINLIKRGEHAR